MNCQDIARILDEQEVDSLLAEERSDVQVHLASCRDCARDWQIHAQLSGDEIPPVPSELRALYVAQVAGVADVGARRRSRFIVIGTLVAVAAAAAMLGAQLTGSAPPVAASVDSPQLESSDASDSGGVLRAASGEHAQKTEQPATKTVQKSVVASPNPGHLRIVLMPTRYDSTDNAARPAMEAFHQSLLQALRNIPDVTIEVAGSAASAADLPANRVTVVSPRVTILSSGDRVYHSGRGENTWTESGSLRSSQFRYVEVMLEPEFRKTPDNNPAMYQHVDGNGVPTGRNCGGDTKLIRDVEDPVDSRQQPASCPSVERLAVHLVAALRPQAQPSASDTVQIISRLSNASSPARDREAAFSELIRRSRPGGIALDAEAIDAIAAYVSSLPPEQRVTSWLMLRGVRQSGLVVPLIESMAHDDDEKVRLQALSTLVKDYISDSRVRTALETVARLDASRFLRMVAQRTLSGDAQWEPYVVATLLDRGLSVTERLAPAQYEAGLANYPEGFEKMQSYLGSQEITRQLLDFLEELRTQARQPASGGFPGMPGAPPGFRRTRQPQDETMRDVVMLLSVTNPSAAIDLWIRILTEDPQTYPQQLAASALLNLLDARRRDDPRVIKALDDIAAGKSGPDLRNQLERALATRQ